MKDVKKQVHSSFSQTELSIINDAMHLLKPILKKHNLRLEDLAALEANEFPSSIFCDELTVLESVVKYLKEEQSMSFRDIAPVIGRDERNIWHIYKRANQKLPEHLEVTDSIMIPFSVFEHKKFSAQEAIVVHLKEDGNMALSEIAGILHRDDRTVWTVYNRAKKK